MKRRSTTLACCLLAALAVSGIAEAKKSYLNSVNNTCGTAYDCGLCHVDPGGGGTLTTEGEGFRDSSYDPTFFCDGSGTNCTDADGDGFFVEGETCGAVDCVDSDANINPGAQEICDDLTDNDCDGRLDCNDNECDSSPLCAVSSEPEICDDGVDDDKDGKTDCADRKDCRGDPACSGDGGGGGGGGEPEICDNGIDDDGDGKIDCSDKKDCGKSPSC
jgi:hypothetical protein